MAEPAYTAAEVAALLQTHRSTVSRHADRLHAIRVGSVLRFPRAFIDSLVSGDFVLPEPEPVEREPVAMRSYAGRATKSKGNLLPASPNSRMRPV